LLLQLLEFTETSIIYHQDAEYFKFAPFANITFLKEIGVIAT